MHQRLAHAPIRQQEGADGAFDRRALEAHALQVGIVFARLDGLGLLGQFAPGLRHGQMVFVQQILAVIQEHRIREGRQRDQLAIHRVGLGIGRQIAVSGTPRDRRPTDPAATVQPVAANCAGRMMSSNITSSVLSFADITVLRYCACRSLVAPPVCAVTLMPGLACSNRSNAWRITSGRSALEMKTVSVVSARAGSANSTASTNSVRAEHITWSFLLFLAGCTGWEPAGGQRSSHA